MPFQKEPRYHVRRIDERTTKELFIADVRGTITQHTGRFVKQWSDGHPAEFTFMRATIMANNLNAQLAKEVLDFIHTHGLPSNRLWHLDPVAP